MNIRIIVKNLVERWGTNNPLKLCEYLKIRIIYKELGNIKGFYIKCLNKKTITINEDLDDLSIKIVLAHELGHAILHKKEINLMKQSFMFPKHSKIETEANLFAAELLNDNNDINIHCFDYDDYLGVKLKNCVNLQKEQ